MHFFVTRKKNKQYLKIITDDVMNLLFHQKKKKMIMIGKN
jgi:hypothetical protein